MDPEKTNRKTHKPIKIKTVQPVIVNERDCIPHTMRYNNYQHCCDFIKKNDGIVII